MDCMTYETLINIFFQPGVNLSYFLQYFSEGMLVFGLGNGEEVLFEYNREDDLFCFVSQGTPL